MCEGQAEMFVEHLRSLSNVSFMGKEPRVGLWLCCRVEWDRNQGLPLLMTSRVSHI